MITLYPNAFKSLDQSHTSAQPPETTNTGFASRLLEELSLTAPPTTPTDSALASPEPTTPSSTAIGPSVANNPNPIAPTDTVKTEEAPVSGTSPVNASAPTVSAAIKNFMEWQSAQPNPFGQGTIADVWAKQGITDPMNNPVLISQAQDMLNRAELRSAMNPNYVAEWSGDWKTQMAADKAGLEQRQAVMAASDLANKVTVGGGMVSALA